MTSVNSDEWFKAISDGDVALIKMMIDSGMDINVKTADDEQYSGLMQAVLLQQQEVAELLLQEGVGANSGDNWVALHWVVRDSHVDLVRILLRYGSNPNTPDADYNQVTPLMRAAFRGNTDITRLLIEHGASIDEVDTLGNTALMIALKEGHFNGPLSLLLEHGADPTIVSAVSRECALEKAAKEGKVPLHVLQQICHQVELNNQKLNPPQDHVDTKLRRIYTRAVDKSFRFRQTEKMMWLLENKARFVDDQTYKQLLTSLVHSIGMSTPTFEAVKYVVSKTSVENVHTLLCQDYLLESRCPNTLKVLVLAATDPLKTSIHGDFGISQNKMSLIFKHQCDQVATLYIQANIVKDVARNAEGGRSFNIFTLAVMHGRIYDIANALIAYGCDVQGERDNLQFMLADSFRRGEHMSHELHFWLQDVTMNPLSLSFLSRIAIRRVLGLHLLHRVDRLSLPASLRDFVMMREFPLAVW